MPSGKDPWNKGYNSDYSSSDEDDEVDASHRRAVLSSEAKLQKDLDFNSRYDPAIFKETPFTLAKIHAARNQRSNSQPSSQDNPISSSSTAVNAASPDSAWKVKNGSVSGVGSQPRAETQAVTRPVPGRNIPISNPDPGGRLDANRLIVEQAKREEARKKQEMKGKKKDWIRYSGWNEKGKPVPITKPKRSAAKQSVVDQLEQLNDSKAKVKAGKPKRTAAKEKTVSKAVDTPEAVSKPRKGKTPKGNAKFKDQDKEKNEGKITFTRIRKPILRVALILAAGATLDSSFPIVQSLNKLREKPLKSGSKASFTKTFVSDLISEDSSDESLSVILGIASQAEKELSITNKATVQMRQLSNLEMLTTDVPPAIIERKSLPTNENAQEVEIGSDIGEIASDNEDIVVDPETRAQREALTNLRETLAKDNAKYKKEKATSEPRAPPPLTSGRFSLYQAGRTPLPEMSQRHFFDSHPRRSDLHGSSQEIPRSELALAGDNGFWRGEAPSIYPATQYIPSSDELPPSTITQVSLSTSLSKYFPPAPPSSSSQLPYSSPLQRHVYGDHQAPQANTQALVETPSPRRLPQYGQESVEYLEGMVEGPSTTWRQPAEAYSQVGFSYAQPAANHYVDHSPVVHYQDFQRGYQSAALYADPSMYNGRRLVAPATSDDWDSKTVDRPF